MKNVIEKIRSILPKCTYKYRIVAVLCRGHKIISVGYNHYSANIPFVHRKHEKTMIHAEMDAIRNAKDRDLIGCSLYLYGTTKCGRIIKAYPCELCQAIIDKVGISKVVVLFDLEREQNDKS